MSVEGQFERLIGHALDEADGIRCSLEDYIFQLRGWQDRLAVRIHNAEADLARERSVRWLVQTPPPGAMPGPEGEKEE